MLGLHRGPLAVDLGIGVGEVDGNELDVAADRVDGPALAALLQPQQDLILHLHVPGIIIFAGLDDAARRGDGIAAAFQFDRVEVGAVRHVIVGVEFAADLIARLELDELVGAGADGRQIGRGVAGLGTLEVGEQMFRQDAAIGPDEGVGPERGRLVEHDADRQIIDLFHGEVAVDADADRRGGGIAGVVPGEHRRRRR